MSQIHSLQTDLELSEFTCCDVPDKIILSGEIQFTRNCAAGLLFHNPGCKIYLKKE